MPLDEIILELRKARLKTIRVLVIAIAICIIAVNWIHLIRDGKAADIEGFGIKLTSCDEEKVLTALMRGELSAAITSEFDEYAIKIGDNNLRDSIIKINNKLDLYRERGKLLLNRLQQADPNDEMEHNILVNDIANYLSEMNQVTTSVINWGLKNQKDMVFGYVDSLSREKSNYKNIAENYKKQLEEELSKNSDKDRIINNQRTLLDQQKVTISELLKQISEDSTLSLNAKREFSELLKNYELEKSINASTQPVSIVNIDFAPISAKRRQDKTYKLNDLKNGIEVYYTVKKNNDAIQPLDQITAVFTYFVKSATAPTTQTPEKAKPIVLNKREKVVLENVNFGKGLYTCTLYYAGNAIGSESFEVR